jgi:hypothetical protein
MTRSVACMRRGNISVVFLAIKLREKALGGVNINNNANTNNHERTVECQRSRYIRLNKGL